MDKLKYLIITIILFLMFGYVLVNTLKIENIEEGEEGYSITLDIMDTLHTYYYEK